MMSIAGRGRLFIGASAGFGPRGGAYVLALMRPDGVSVIIGM
jgi:hypothetical protein